MAETRLWFLDEIGIQHAGDEVAARLVPRKLTALLAILAAERTRTASVEAICQLLWPEATEPNCRKSLNQLLVRGRRVLPDVLERPAEHLVGLAPTVRCDVQDLLFANPFATLSAAPPHAAYELLPGFSIRGCPELNDWIDATRTTVRARAARLALERAGSLSGADAFSWAALAYRLDRADERAAAAYIRFLGEVRGPSAAWAAFTQHRRWLADTLDIKPSAALTSLAAVACREAGAIAAVAHMAPPSAAQTLDSEAVGAGPMVVGPARSRFGWLRRVETFAAIGVLAVSSGLVWKTMGTHGAAAGTDVVFSSPVLAGARADTALRLASAHLAEHGLAAGLAGDPATGIRVFIPGWRGASARQLSLVPQPPATAAMLAAAVVDSVLALVRRGNRSAAVAGSNSRSPPRAYLAGADSAVAAARSLVSNGGPSPALVMLARADTLAVRAARGSGDWQALLLRSEIANLRYWYRYQAGNVDAGTLERATALADSAVKAGGGAAALRAAASQRFWQWVSGASDAEAAGVAAESAYAALAEASPGDGEAWTHLAQLYHADGRFRDAYSAAKEAEPLVNGTDRLATHMELFLSALDDRDNHDARYWCREIQFHHPGSWYAAFCATMYAWADPASPMPALSNAMFAEPTDMRLKLEQQLLMLEAGAHLARGNEAVARRKIEAARAGLGDNPELAAAWAGVLVELGQPDSALATLRAYLDGAPSRRLAAGRPWFRALRQPNEDWQEFIGRLTARGQTPTR